MKGFTLQVWGGPRSAATLRSYLRQQLTPPFFPVKFTELGAAIALPGQADAGDHHRRDAHPVHPPHPPRRRLRFQVHARRAEPSCSSRTTSWATGTRAACPLKATPNCVAGRIWCCTTPSTRGGVPPDQGLGALHLPRGSGAVPGCRAEAIRPDPPRPAAHRPGAGPARARLPPRAEPRGGATASGPSKGWKSRSRAGIIPGNEPFHRCAAAPALGTQDRWPARAGTTPASGRWTCGSGAPRRTGTWPTSWNPGAIRRRSRPPRCTWRKPTPGWTG